MESNNEPNDSSRRVEKKHSKASVGWFIIFGVVLVILVFVVLSRVKETGIFTSSGVREQKEVEKFLAETGSWHAVFLTNGQVYFGQLENSEAQYAVLRDIYYLQDQQKIQMVGQIGSMDFSSSDGESVVVSAQPSLSRLTLIKFGTEIHAPEDFIRLNRDHILFWEELTVGSQVVRAIQNYKEDL